MPADGPRSLRGPRAGGNGPPGDDGFRLGIARIACELGARSHPEVTETEVGCLWSINERLGFLCDCAGRLLKVDAYERPGYDEERLSADYLDDMLLIMLKKAKEMIGADKVPSFVERFSPALAGVLAGAGLYFAQKNKARASGHAVGAVAAGLAAQAAVELKARFPQYFADVVDLRLSGIIINDPVARMNGLVIDDPAPGLAGYADNAGLNSLAALSMAVDADDYDGFGELLN